MSIIKAKVPAVVVSGVVCLALGIGAGMGIMVLSNDKSGQQASAGPAGTEGGKEQTPPGMGGMGGMGGKAGAGKGTKNGPSPKTQLAQLVGKIDVLTRKPLTVQLSAEQRQQAKELLAGIEAKDELTDDEAKAKLDALLKLVESQKETLEAAGYRWPTQGGGGPGGGGFGGGGGGAGGPGGGGGPPPNPFKTGEAADRLKSLQTTLAK